MPSPALGIWLLDWTAADTAGSSGSCFSDTGQTDKNVVCTRNDFKSFLEWMVWLPSAPPSRLPWDGDSPSWMRKPGASGNVP